MDLTPRLTETLGWWQAALEADAVMHGHEPATWIFPSETGTPLDGRTWRRLSAPFSMATGGRPKPYHSTERAR